LGSWGIALLVAALAGSALAGCGKKKQEETKATAEKADAKKKPQGDRYADGKRLATSMKEWSKRWSETQELPACDPLLKQPADLELCKTAATSLTNLKAAVAKPEPEAVLIKSAAELALATENASEKLRAASMEKMQSERHSGPGGSASGKPAGLKAPITAASALSKLPKAAEKIASASGSARVESPAQDPAMQVMQMYSRVNRASLRFLSQFLQFGPLETRRTAFAELEGLTKKKETWPALGRTLREAAMAENDPDLQGKLKALAPKLSRRPSSAMPAGHPPAEAAAATPAPAPAEQK
jgi:hypothetical protein